MQTDNVSVTPKKLRVDTKQAAWELMAALLGPIFHQAASPTMSVDSTMTLFTV